MKEKESSSVTNDGGRPILGPNQTRDKINDGLEFLYSVAHNSDFT